MGHSRAPLPKQPALRIIQPEQVCTVLPCHRNQYPILGASKKNRKWVERSGFVPVSIPNIGDDAPNGVIIMLPLLQVIVYMLPLPVETPPHSGNLQRPSFILYLNSVQRPCWSMISCFFATLRISSMSWDTPFSPHKME